MPERGDDDNLSAERDRVLDSFEAVLRAKQTEQRRRQQIADNWDDEDDDAESVGPVRAKLAEYLRSGLVALQPSAAELGVLLEALEDAQTDLGHARRERDELSAAVDRYIGQDVEILRLTEQVEQLTEIRQRAAREHADEANHLEGELETERERRQAVLADVYEWRQLALGLQAEVERLRGQVRELLDSMGLPADELERRGAFDDAREVAQLQAELASARDWAVRQHIRLKSFEPPSVIADGERRHPWLRD